MLRTTCPDYAIRALGSVFFRENILTKLEEFGKTDVAFAKSSDRPYPIAEIVRRMVRIKKKSIAAIAHGDDHEHILLRGEYKYFTGKQVDVRGAGVGDLIAFVQCCGFFRFYDVNALDRVLEELSLKIPTLQPLEVLALMAAVSDLPSKNEGNVDVEGIKSSYDEEDSILRDLKAEHEAAKSEAAQKSAAAVADKIREAERRRADREREEAEEASRCNYNKFFKNSKNKKYTNANALGGRGSGSQPPVNPFYLSRKEAQAFARGSVFSLPSINNSALSSSSTSEMSEIMNNKNFTDFRYRKLPIGSDSGSEGAMRGGGGGDVASSSNSAAKRDAELKMKRLHTEEAYHQTLTATFFRDLSDQALLFLGGGGENSDPSSAACQFSLEEQLEMLATLPEGTSQDLVMTLLDTLAAPLLHFDHYCKMNAAADEYEQQQGGEGGGHSADRPPLTPMVEQGQHLFELYTAMPWHAVTILKGLLLVEIEERESILAAKRSLEASFEHYRRDRQRQEMMKNGGVGESMFEESRESGMADSSTTSSSSFSTPKQMSKILYRQQRARQVLQEREERSEGNALFIFKVSEVLGDLIASTAAKPFVNPTASARAGVLEDEDVGANNDDGELLAFSRQCSDAIPASDPRKLHINYRMQLESSGKGGVAGGGGEGGAAFGAGTGSSAREQRLFGRTHMLNCWEIGSACATMTHLLEVTGAYVRASRSDDEEEGEGNRAAQSASASLGLPLHISKALQQAYLLQLPQSDAASLALMFSSCKPNSNRYEDEGEDGVVGEGEEEEDFNRREQRRQREEEFLVAQKQFFSFLQKVEERVLYFSAHFTTDDVVNVLACYLEAYSTLASMHDSLVAELSEAQHNLEVSQEEVSQLKKEISMAKARLSASSNVLDDLINTAFHHLGGTGKGMLGGEVSDHVAPLRLLTAISLFVFDGKHADKPSPVGSSPPLPIDSSSSVLAVKPPAQIDDISTLIRPLTMSQLWFHRFPQLQPLIHALGSAIIFESRKASFSVNACILVLQISVRLGSKMLDAAVSAVLQRLAALIAEEDYAVSIRHTATASSGSSAASPDDGLSIEKLVPLPSIEGAEAMARRMQQDKELADASATGSASLTRDPKSLQAQAQLEYAASVAARNQAELLFDVLSDLCKHTERRIERAAAEKLKEESSRVSAAAEAVKKAHSDAEIVLKPSASAAPAAVPATSALHVVTAFEGMRPKQVDFINRMLLPALRKAALASSRE